MSTTGQPPLLADTLKVLLPGPRETLFLQACLAPGARAGESWRAWFGAHADIQAAISGKGAVLKPLLPLLHFALTEHGIELDPPTLAVLRAAAIWEGRRSKRVREILSDVLGILARAGVEPVLLNGTALAATAYPRPALRHCHDIDFWIPDADLVRAQEALTRSGLFAAGTSRTRRAVNLVHSEGLPVNLLRSLTASTLCPLPETEMRKRTVSISVMDQPVDALSPIDALIHLCSPVGGGAVLEPTIWVADAACLLRRSAPTGSDWDIAIRAATASGLSLTLFAILSYLREEIGIMVPDDVLGRVEAEASHSRRSHRDAVLAGARKAQGGRLGPMFRHSNWRSRAEIIRFLALPSQAFLQEWCADRGFRWSPFWYALRPLRRPALKLGLMRKARRASWQDRPTD